MLNPTLLCIKPINVVNSFIPQPKAILGRRTLRLTKSTSTTTKPEKERKLIKPENREGKTTKLEISGWNHFVKITHVRPIQLTPLDMVARDNILISGFDASQLAHKTTASYALNANCNVTIPKRRSQ